MRLAPTPDKSAFSVQRLTPARKFLTRRMMHGLGHNYRTRGMGTRFQLAPPS
jgi:hypothetical protein